VDKFEAYNKSFEESRAKQKSDFEIDSKAEEKRLKRVYKDMLKLWNDFK